MYHNLIHGLLSNQIILQSINCRSIKFPALKSLASNEFSNLVQSQVTEGTAVVVFVEPKLSIEDLTGCKRTGGVTCFENLNTIQSKSYFPNVASPLEGLYDVPSDEQIQVSASDNILDVAGSGKIVFVELDLAKSPDDYVKHDTLIGDVYDQLAEKFRNVVVIYTGRQDSANGETLVRKTRQAEPAATVKDWDLKNDNNFAIVAEKFTVRQKDSTTVQEHKLSSVTSTLTDNTLTVKITTEGGPEIDLSFKSNGGNWALTEAKKDADNLVYPAYIFGKLGSPMRCGESLTFRQGSTYYSIVNSQFLPSFASGNDPLTFPKSADVVHCNGYWTPGIVSGLFVILIFAIIMTWGISFIMDINTMDKFDDPKGKTITINATD